MPGFAPLGSDPVGGSEPTGSTFTLSPVGRASTLAYGVAALSFASVFSVSATARPSSATYGAATVDFTVPAPFSLSPAGKPSGVSFGAAALTFTVPGDGGGAVDPAAVWGYVMPNGQTAGQMLTSLMTLADELHRIHGLNPAAPLSVSPTVRSAGSIQQSFVESGDTITATRV